MNTQKNDALAEQNNAEHITLNLHQAAQLLLIHPVTLQSKAKAGIIPGAKIGKRWVFIKNDLIEWLRSQYTSPRQDVGQGGKKLCSIKEKTVNIGGIASHHQTAQQY